MSYNYYGYRPELAPAPASLPSRYWEPAPDPDPDDPQEIDPAVFVNPDDYPDLPFF